MAEERTAKITDKVQAQLVECVSPPEPVAQVPPSPAEAPTPTDRARDETLGQTGADPPPSALSLDARLRSLRANHIALAKRLHAVESWQDTCSSSLYKRLSWWLQGYRWRRLGRWYRPRWED
jgi:hypothetical protein